MIRAIIDRDDLDFDVYLHIIFLKLTANTYSEEIKAHLLRRYCFHYPNTDDLLVSLDALWPQSKKFFLKNFCVVNKKQTITTPNCSDAQLFFTDLDQRENTGNLDINAVSRLRQASKINAAILSTAVGINRSQRFVDGKF